MSHTYAFVGLTPSERSLLESLFAFDADGGEQLVCVRDPGQADLILVNGDDAEVVQQLCRDQADALIVLVGQAKGSHALPGLPVIRRPLELAGVVAVLSTLDWPEVSRGGDRTDFSEFERSRQADSASAPATLPPTVAPSDMADALRSASAPVPAMVSAQAASQPPRPPASAPSRPPAPLSARQTWAVSEPVALPVGVEPQAGGAFAPRAQDGDADVMVVTQRKGGREPTLPRGIRRLGYSVCVANGSREALEMLDQRPIPFVFLDQASLGDQLQPLARALQARHVPGMHVVVVARRVSVFDRLRARVTGCVWMHVPIDRGRLVAFFARRGLRRSV